MTTEVRYSEFHASADLREAVTAFWYVEGDGRHVPSPAILPDGHLELVFNFGDPVALAGPGYAGDQPARAVVGPLSRALRMAYRGRVRALGVRFHPACGSAFFRRPGTELVDRLVPIAELDEQLDESIGQLQLDRVDLQTERGRAPLDRLLLERWRSSNPPDVAVVALVDRISESPTSLRVSELAGELGISPRHLQRRFLAAVGMPPKRFARVVRFARVWQLAAMSPAETWAHLAVDHGYADQAHLIREFRAFGAEPPARTFGPEWYDTTKLIRSQGDASDVRSIQDRRRPRPG